MAVVGVACLRAETPLVAQGARGDPQPSPPDKAAELPGSGCGGKTQWRCLGRVLGRVPPKSRLTRYGLFQVTVYSKVLCELLRKPVDIDKLRPFIEHCEDCAKNFLKGFFASEGSVTNNGSILCYNSDKRLLNYVKRLLRHL